jgi:hypothetical protein
MAELLIFAVTAKVPLYERSGSSAAFSTLQFPGPANAAVETQTTPAMAEKREKDIMCIMCSVLGREGRRDAGGCGKPKAPLAFLALTGKHTIASA